MPDGRRETASRAPSQPPNQSTLRPIRPTAKVPRVPSLVPSQVVAVGTLGTCEQAPSPEGSNAGIDQLGRRVAPSQIRSQTHMPATP
jgi:hypothetical protein